MFKSYLNMFRNYANFSGKTTRKQFWSAIGLHTFILLLSDFGIILSSSSYRTGISKTFLGLVSFSILYRFITWFPLWTITVRRLHDIQKNGWWILLYLIPVIGQILLLVFLLRKSRENRMEKILFEMNPALRSIANRPRKGGWIWLPLILIAACIFYYFRDQYFQTMYLSAVSFFAENIGLYTESHTDIIDKPSDFISSIQNNSNFPITTDARTVMSSDVPEIQRTQAGILSEVNVVPTKEAGEVSEIPLVSPSIGVVDLENGVLKSKMDETVIIRIHNDRDTVSSTAESELSGSGSINNFWIDRYEVTNQQYHHCETSGICAPPNSERSATAEDYYEDEAYANYPVINVTYYQAETYCNWAGRRLPTNLEWESAAKNESGDPYPWGKTFSKEKTNAVESRNRDTQAVGTYPRGRTKDSIYDFSGNVWEWVNSEKDTNNDVKNIRGGGWNSYADSVQVTSELLVSSKYFSDNLGFRCGISTNEINPEFYSPFEIENDIPSEDDLPESGSERDRESDGMIEVFIPEGEFVMGNPNGAINEKPAHSVFVSSFWMDKMEVSNQQYASCVRAGACTDPIIKKSFKNAAYFDSSEFENFPVIQVTWQQADDYCKWIGGRLPTEAEWEKAAKGPEGTLYPWGNEFIAEYLNFSGSGINDTQPVDGYENGISGYGILNLSGNVAEWVLDRYAENWYSITNQPQNPTGPEAGTYRILRGGSWLTSQITAQTVNRFQSVPTGAAFDRGFRCVRQK